MTSLFQRALEAGRKLRTGTKAGEKVDEAEAEALADEAIAILARVDEQALADRDDVESILFFLGDTGNAKAERRLLQRAHAVDTRLLEHRDEWDAAPATPTQWLQRIAALDASTWWLDRVSLLALRGKSDAKALLAKPKTPQPLRLRAPSAAQVAQADVVGQEDTPGVVIARLFDGEIDVHAIGVEAFVLVGLRVCGDNIENVTLRGVAGFAGASGWWIPLPADARGTCELVVRRQGKDESLPIELTA